jgi:propionyl-CoA carboxylase beta chain
VKTVTNETVTSEVGGASTHATKSGVAHTSTNDVRMSGRLETVTELFTTKQ